MATQRLTGAGVELSAIVEGDGPPVLLLHGFPDSKELWRNQIPVLVEAGYQVIAPDMRGFGDSERPEEVADYGLDKIVGDVAAILDGLGHERAHIVGHDWGAILSWMVATFVPDRVDHLVAISVGRPGTRPRSMSELHRLWYMFMFQFDEAEDYLSRNDYANLRVFAAGAPDPDDIIARMSKPGALRAGMQIYRANASPATILSEGFELPKITSPTMGVWSTEDFALGERQMTASEADVEGTWRYERIEGVGHWIPLDAAERLNELLLDFLPAP